MRCEWVEGMADMRQRRCKFPAIVYENEIWVLGGQSGDRSTIADVEIYNPKTNTWRDGPRMNNPRQDHAAFVHHGCLFVLGGQFAAGGDQNIVLRPEVSIEKLDANTNTWNVLRISMPSVISIFSAGPPVVIPWVRWPDTKDGRRKNCRT